MKAGMHPELKVVKVKCTCGSGHEWETLSTVEDMSVEICSLCHPFFTGEERFVDTAGRVELFQRKYGNILEQAESGESSDEKSSK